jgi:hypothetical protein
MNLILLNNLSPLIRSFNGTMLFNSQYLISLNGEISHLLSAKYLSIQTTDHHQDDQKLSQAFITLVPVTYIFWHFTSFDMFFSHTSTNMTVQYNNPDIFAPHC